MKMDHDNTLTPGVGAFCAIKQAHHIQTIANYGYVYELTHNLRSHIAEPTVKSRGQCVERKRTRPLGVRAGLGECSARPPSNGVFQRRRHTLRIAAEGFRDNISAPTQRSGS